MLDAQPEAEARRAVASLARRGVAATTSRDDDGRWRVAVNAGDVSRAVTALQDDVVPRQAQAGFAEVWGERSLVATPPEERARAAQAVAGELARTLTSMDGVLDARVHLALAEPADLGGDRPPTPARASVLLVHHGSPPVRIDEVRALVAGAVAGMRSDDVSVVFARRGARETAPVAWTTTLGFHVARAQATTLRAVMLALFAAALTAAGVAAHLWRRRARGATTTAL